jgi:type IV pilus modification protein PilV
MKVMNSKAANFKGCDDGFTLIEVMIAIAVLTIGILAVIAMQVHSINGNASAMHRTRALTIGQDAMERIMGTPFSTLATGTTTSINGAYTATQVIADPPAASPFTNADALWITITTTWQEGAVQKSIPLTFIKSLNMERSYAQ